MNSPSDNKPDQSPFDLASGYPSHLPADQLGGVPLYNPKASRKMDRFIGLAMTLLGVIGIFLVLIVLLKSVSPPPPGELVPTSRASLSPVSADEQTGKEEIVGD